MRSWSKHKPPLPHDAAIKRRRVPASDRNLAGAALLLLELGSRPAIAHPYWQSRKRSSVKVSPATKSLRGQLRR